MSNPKPDRTRQAKSRRRARKAADMTVAHKVSWTVIRELETILLDAESDTETRIKTAHALNQALGTYTKMNEAVELAARVEELEKTFVEREKTLRRVA